MSIEIGRNYYRDRTYPHRLFVCGKYVAPITTEQADYLDRLVECPAPGIFPLGDGTFIARGDSIPTDGTWQWCRGDGHVFTVARPPTVHTLPYIIAPVEPPGTLTVPAQLADKIREAFPEVQG